MSKLHLLIVLVLGIFLSGCSGGSSSPPPPPQNQAPTANAGTDRAVDEGSAVYLVGTSWDSDGWKVSYAWQQDSALL